MVAARARERNQATVVCPKYDTPIKLMQWVNSEAPMAHLIQNVPVRVGSLLRALPTARKASTMTVTNRAMPQMPPRTPSRMYWLVTSWRP
ncbi:MAG: hypothetical protein KatS3mg103_0100 [Phycisphaerales bacterium]|nr:MAG: hypothetical protein KatS3mg103_0100 [Phycisphaerales bacterium]